MAANKKSTTANGSTTTEKAAPVKLTEAQTAAWRGIADKGFEAACAELENASPELIKLFAVQGIASRIDNKYSTAAGKLAAIEAGAIGGLEELKPTASRGEKESLIKQAFEAIQHNPACAAILLPAVTSGKVQELKDALAAIAAKA